MLPLTPTKLGRYEIVDEIGKGAMGVVYLARDPLIGRLVALKTFRIGYSVKDHEMEQFRVRFLREAQSAGILTHPHIVTIHDVVEQTEEGMAFIAMEYVRGTTLKAVLQSEQALSLGYVVDVISQVAEALDYAHSHRVIHRDVKPANILITADNRVKITDFGIARLDTSNLTQEGQLLGTPNYMAPEQIQGKEVDHRADLFALGVVLYEMLTRHKPFQGENLTVVSHRIVYDQFTPPREYSKDLPPGLEKILDRALEKDPARRYQRAKDMVEDLRRLLAESSRDDLNETMSIASWVAAPPPPVPGGMGAADAGTVISSAPPPRPAAKAKAPRAPRTPLSFKRIGLFAVLGALILVLGVVALRLGVAWSGGRAAVEPAANDRNARYHALILEGEERLREADYGAALQSFSRAVDLAPNDFEKTRVLGRIKDAEAQNLAYLQTLSQSSQIAGYLKMGTDALTDERYADAVKAADLTLAGDAANVEALRIKTEAEAGLARLRQQKARSTTARTPAAPQVAVATPQPEASPSPETPVRAAENQPSRLRISIQSEVSEVTIRIDGKNGRLFSQTFHGERSLMRKAKSFTASAIVEVPAGDHDLRALIVPGGKAGKSKAFTVPGGSFLTLEIRVSESGDVSFSVS
jgi:tRNA A-37 threonylcarbamoyl transferase component Bud32/tetratricopeptide (TPR) repeat protein